MEKDSRVKAVISLDAVEQNFREMRKNIAEETKMIAVIKADAYGHGAVPVAHLIEDYDYIWGFAAATAEEAIHLREAGITKPILILGIVFDEYFPELVRYEIRPAVCEYEEAKETFRRSGSAEKDGTYSYCSGHRNDQNRFCGYTGKCRGNQKDRRTSKS